MIQNIKKILILKSKNIIGMLILIAAIAAMAVIIGLILIADEEEGMLNVMIAGVVPTGYLAGSYFFKLMFYADETSRGLSLGITRKTLFIYSRLYDLVEVLLIALVCIACNVVSINLIIKCALLIFAFQMILEGLGASSIVRYGKTAYWVCYAFFLVICIGLPRLLHAIPAVGDASALLMDYITNPVYNQGTVWIGILVVTAFTVIINWITYRRIPVNFVM